MSKVVAKLFRRPEDVDKAVAELKGAGCEATVLEQGANIDKELAESGLPEQALEYFKTGLVAGGKVVKVDAAEDKVEEVNRLLLSTGFNSLIDRPAQWFTSPGFVKSRRMSSTNPIDAQMSGDFRKY